MIPLIVLRPAPGAVETADRARALGLAPVICSLFMVEPQPWDAPDPAAFDALLLTSANAVRHGGAAVSRFTMLPVFTVGAATAQAARDFGFNDVTEGAGNAADSLRAIRDAGFCRPLHLVGQDRTAYPELAFPVVARTVYATVPAVVTLPPGRCVALLHSARAAHRFAQLCTEPALVDIVAISALAANAAAFGWRSVTVAAAPDDNAMLALARRLCDGTVSTTGPT